MATTPKLQITLDSEGRNGTFLIDDEDHTLGNSLRFVISNNSAVDLVGYSVPHPSVRNISVRVQSYQSQNTQATTILRQGLKDLNEIATHILTSFNDQFEEFENKMFD